MRTAGRPGRVNTVGRPEKPIPPDCDPATRDFAQALRDLKRDRKVSYRQMAEAANYSSTALSQAASGAALPSQALALAYAVACGGDPAEWTSRWEAAARAHQPAPPPPVPGTSEIEVRRVFPPADGPRVEYPLINQVFSQEIRALRQEAGLTAAAMTSRARLTPVDFNRIETGRAHLVRVEAIVAYVRACGGDVPMWVERWRRVASPPVVGRTAAAVDKVGTGELVATGDIVHSVTLYTEAKSGDHGHDVWHPSESKRVTAFSKLVTPQEFVDALRALRAEAGMPSIRAMSRAAQAAGISVPHSTLHDALRGHRLPSRPVVQAVATACRLSERETKVLLEAWRRQRTSDEPQLKPRSETYMLLSKLIANPEFWKWAQRSTPPLLTLIAVLVYATVIK
ncbi:helix-turn-helix domain-containing protein [Kitasatospora arboriphila]